MNRNPPQLVVALDTPDEDQALHLVDHLSGLVSWFKVGLELFTAQGPAIVRALSKRGAEIFLDLKYHDIPNTVARAVTQAVQLDVGLLDLHLSGGMAMVRQAVAARDAAAHHGVRTPALLGITVLTSLGEPALKDLGISRSPEEQVLALTTQGLAAGLDGVVASPREIRSLRARFGPEIVIVAPGIRPEGSALDDQTRTLTPHEAAEAGADYLVVGRPITSAPDPVMAARAILDSLTQGR